MKGILPNLFHEKRLWKKNFLVIGIDEVGRGSFAGPLVVGAVIFKPTVSRKIVMELENIGINDSKKLSSRKREKLSKIIKKKALFYSFASINVTTINKVGIGKATYIGVRKITKSIISKISNPKYNIQNTKYYLLIDAFYVKYVKGIGLKNQKAIIHGDEISLSIAAASIIAKVKRDNYMKNLAKKYPDYGFDQHKGYGTLKHRQAIKKYGKTNIHRNSYLRNLK